MVGATYAGSASRTAASCGATAARGSQPHRSGAAANANASAASSPSPNCVSGGGCGISRCRLDRCSRSGGGCPPAAALERMRSVSVHRAVSPAAPSCRITWRRWPGGGGVESDHEATSASNWRT
ncbi:hypothetical protein HK405_007372, partial [Cladochytrium tenue]